MDISIIRRRGRKCITMLHNGQDSANINSFSIEYQPYYVLCFLLQLQTSKPIASRCSLEQDRRARSYRRYDLMWERSPILEKIIANSWTSRGTERNLGKVKEALTTVIFDLHAWSNITFGNISRELEKSRSPLEELTHMNADRLEIRREMDKMNELLYKEEMLWLQRSMIDWL